MKAVCPDDPTHKRFVTVAHVVQDWVVDDEGHFIDEIETTETVHGPNPGNTWTCYECGAAAEVTDA